MIYYNILHTVAIELQNAEDIWTVRFFFSCLFSSTCLLQHIHWLLNAKQFFVSQTNGSLRLALLKNWSMCLSALSSCVHVLSPHSWRHSNLLSFVEGRVFIKPFSLPQICKIASAATANSVHVYCCLCLTNLFSWVFFSVIEKPSDTHLARLKRNHESKSSGWGAKSSQRQKSASNWCADFNATLKTTSYHT